ncbi:DUF7123 family protein [Halapricum hydrolyticum]|uniref:DUF7123 domain-containing protein n=1 Tax=Halapricum hydrolyticum TaxID=2979991 RepID=A0AAE3LET3_9EURY|nr:hypothetical protein [Halapricum hydrolyticum]MCU4717630.1 hypothetical protein [Halapricum hydrolyticum]MCU4726841.1 hypothetical protein [Halapricum hydrolyticum]
MSQATANKRQRVETHLRQRIGEEPIYVKSKFLAEELDLSAKEIGSVLGRLAESSSGLVVERWSYTNATTWRIEQKR